MATEVQWKHLTLVHSRYLNSAFHIFDKDMKPNEPRTDPTAYAHHNTEYNNMNVTKLLYTFKVCKSVHHCTIQMSHQPDATIFQFIILMFIYSSTCFGRSPAHHQELNDCSRSLRFYLCIAVIAVLCLWLGWLTGPTTNIARLSPRYEGKTRGCYRSHWAPDDGRENAQNMLSCK